MLELFRNQDLLTIQMYCNAQMTSKMISEYCALSDKGVNLLRHAMERLQLSARAHDRILKVARTAADLEGSMIMKITILQKRSTIEALTGKVGQDKHVY